MEINLTSLYKQTFPLFLTLNLCSESLITTILKTLTFCSDQPCPCLPFLGLDAVKTTTLILLDIKTLF